MSTHYRRLKLPPQYTIAQLARLSGRSRHAISRTLRYLDIKLQPLGRRKRVVLTRDLLLAAPEWMDSLRFSMELGFNDDDDDEEAA